MRHSTEAAKAVASGELVKESTKVGSLGNGGWRGAGRLVGKIWWCAGLKGSPGVAPTR